MSAFSSVSSEVPTGILSLGSISFLSGICTLPLPHVSTAFGWKLDNLHNRTVQLWALGSMLFPGWVTPAVCVCFL